MANAVENTHRGTVIDMENCRTSSAADVAGPTCPKTASGLATTATAPCATAGHNSPLSDAERSKLAKIRRDRRNGWMASFEDFDFLLGVVDRLSRMPSYSDRENPDL